MCQFKSGLILKNRSFVPDYDSHSDMLKELGFEDDYLNATKSFVRAEMVPLNNEWWTDPNGWSVNIDQDVTPDWFNIDKDKYISDFKAAVEAWWNEHILIDKKIEELCGGHYRLKRCEVKKLLNDVKVWCDSSTVQGMYGSSTVQEMYGSSTVQGMYDSSTVQRMCGSSTVQRMYGSSTVQEMYGSSTVQGMCDSSTVQEMCGSSTVQGMCGNSIARDYSKGKIYISAETSLTVEAFVNKGDK